MKDETLKRRGGDPNKRGYSENPYRYQLPKQAQSVNEEPKKKRA